MRKSPKSINEPEIKFSLRVPESTYERIRKAAEGERRSINSQVVLILEQWISAHPDITGQLDAHFGNVTLQATGVLTPPPE